MAHTHIVVISVPLRVAVDNAETAAAAIVKARGAIYDWLAQIEHDPGVEHLPPTVLSVEPKK